MSKSETRKRTPGMAGMNDAGSENAYDAAGEQQAVSGNNQSGAEGSGAANQVAAQLAELLRSNPDALKDVLAQAGQSTGQAAGQLQQHLPSRFDKQKENLVKGLGSMVEEVRQMSRNLKRSEQSGIVPIAAQYGDSAADRIEQLSNYISGRDVSQLVGEAAGYAQRNAAYIVPGAFLLGLLGARFLKSANPKQSSNAESDYSKTDVALPTSPPSPPSGNAMVAAASAGSATLDRTPQPAQAS